MHALFFKNNIAEQRIALRFDTVQPPLRASIVSPSGQMSSNTTKTRAKKTQIMDKQRPI